MKPLLTVRELAKLLKVHEVSVRRLISKKIIPFLKIPGIGVRFLPDEIEKWIKKERKCKYFKIENKDYQLNPDEYFMKRHLDECYKCKELTVDLLRSKEAHERWENEQYIFNYFKGRLYPGISRNKLTITDKEVIKAKIRLFQLQRKKRR